MTTVFSEPEHSYEDLVELAIDQCAGLEELPAITAALGAPGARLWLSEEHGHVCRVWRKRHGVRARWALHDDLARDAEKWINKKLADTVLARLTEPGWSREYALDPGLVDQDLAVLEEIERIHLSWIPLPLKDPVLVDRWLQNRMARINAELARAKALRARHLRDAYGDGEEGTARVAAALECDPHEAREALAARDRFTTWVRQGAGRSRDRYPVRRPSGPTGLPDDRAALLMTVACEREVVVPDRPYPRPLPPDLAPWHVYIEALGHCVAVAVEDLYEPDGDPRKYMTTAPVPLVLRGGWRLRDQIVVSDIPYECWSDTIVIMSDDTEREF